ncbi:hypothetical protein JCM10450v2_003054 [Rhodotorula kratochvilovae]
MYDLPLRVYTLPQHYSDPPTKEQQQALEQRRADFLAAPLVPGLRVPFVPQDNACAYQHTSRDPPPIPSPNPQRPVNGDLLRALASTRRPSRCVVVLKERLSPEKNVRGQVWRSVVECDGRDEGDVVIKLLVESVFTYPGVQHPAGWYTAEQLAANEARAYAAFQPVQGTDVPYCYALGRFRMPNGEDVPGFLVEDLGPSAVRIDAACPWAEDEDLGVEDIEDIAQELFQGQRRLLACGIARLDVTHRDVFLLRGYDYPHPVFIGFSYSMSLEAFKEQCRDTAIWAKEADVEGFVRDWQAFDEAYLNGSLDTLFPHAYPRWLRRELLGEGKLGLLLSTLCLL